MPEQIISASGTQYGLVVNDDGSINVSGVDLSIGSLAVLLEDVYVTSGTMYVVSGDNINLGTAWTDIGSVHVSNVIPISGTALGGSQTWVQQVIPNDTSQNNPHYNFVYMRSGAATNVTGSSIGSVIQFIGAGSYVSTWTYDNNNLVDIGSYI